CGGLEQPHARRVATDHHVATRDVERERRAVVERAVSVGSEMLDALDVGRPFDRRRILRTGDDEATRRRATRGLDQEPLYADLAILAVRPHVRELPAPLVLL